MNKELKVIACIFALLVLLSVLILSLRLNTRDIELSKFCGTITYRDGSVKSIKMVISGQDDKMSFDFRSNPGMLNLHRCGEGE